MIRIALVFSYTLQYCRGVLNGIKEYARGKPDWSLLLVGPELAGVKRLRALQVNGVIAYIFTEPLVKLLGRQPWPTVNVCGVLPTPRIPRVGVDNVQVGRLAAEHLLERGFRHFAYMGHPGHVYARERESGFGNRLNAAGCSVHAYYEPASLPFDPMGNPGLLDRRLCRWLASLPKPAGIFACNDPLGIQLAQACRQTQLGVPEEVAIIGALNDDLLCELAQPPLSSVAAPLDRIGYEAAALLDRLLAGARPPPAPLVFPPTGVVTRYSSDFLAIEDADVAAALRFIRREGHRPVRIGDVLRQVPVSRRSLERRFRRVLHRSLGDEIRRVHLELAKKLLTETGLSMPEVAARAGFTSAKQLSVIFHRETGLTPSGFRRDPP